MMLNILQTCRPKYWFNLLALLATLAVSLTSPLVSAETLLAPLATYTNVQGEKLSTAEFKGHPTMLFLLSTWCGSCAAGLRSLNEHADGIRESGLHLVILRTVGLQTPY